MRFDFVRPLAVVILLCCAAEASAFAGLVLLDRIHGVGLRQAIPARLAMHPLAPKTVIPFGPFDPLLGNHWPANTRYGNVTSNAHGFISNAPDGASPAGYPDKPENVFRIVLLGNSTMAGIALHSDATQTISAKLEALLNGAADGRRYQVLNFGVSGGYSFSELRLFFTEVIHVKPDAVISLDGYTDAVEAAFARERNHLDHAMIDWTQPVVQQYDRIQGLEQPRTPPPPLIFTYIYLALEQAGLFQTAKTPIRAQNYEQIPWYRDSAEILNQTDGWNLQLGQNIESIAAYCKERGIFFIGYLQPFAAYARAPNDEERVAVAAFHAALINGGDKYWDLDSYTKQMADYYARFRELYRALAREYEDTPNVRFADISELFATEPRAIYLDAAHYNELGDQTIAERFAADLTSLIAEAPAQPIDRMPALAK
jgi:hypothetical protein